MATVHGNTYINDYIGSDKHALPSLFALYDTLNDDDDEIRELGAKTVSSIVGESLVPLAARDQLANEMNSWHYDSNSYSWNVVRRLTGHSSYEPFHDDQCHLMSADEQLQKALENDDSLFVEEEHNLFIDEIREAELWCRIFEEKDLVRPDAYTKRLWEIPDTMLADWVLQGLDAMNKLLASLDGPLGWSSKPAVFAICMRILLSANSLLRRQAALALEENLHEVTKEQALGGIVTALKKFVAIGMETGVHERLLFEAEDRLDLSL